jgi:predicted nuclease of predicted toxin-antitoxin system
VVDAGLDRAEGLDILRFAQQEGRVCIALDHDFHRHLALARSAGPSVIFIRLEGLGAEVQAAPIRHVLEICSEALDHGSASRPCAE